MNAPSLILKLGNLANDHLVLVLVGYVVVFISLSLLWFVFYNLRTLLKLRIGWNLKHKVDEPQKKAQENSITVEETAAISAAIFLLVEELHDEENTVLTIQKISRRYSPWNSKIYSVTNGLNKRF